MYGGRCYVTMFAYQPVGTNIYIYIYIYIRLKYIYISIYIYIM